MNLTKAIEYSLLNASDLIEIVSASYDIDEINCVKINIVVYKISDDLIILIDSILKDLFTVGTYPVIRLFEYNKTIRVSHDWRL